jgi:hypothetical protein
MPDNTTVGISHEAVATVAGIDAGRCRPDRDMLRGRVYADQQLQSRFVSGQEHQHHRQQAGLTGHRDDRSVRPGVGHFRAGLLSASVIGGHPARKPGADRSAE